MKPTLLILAAGMGSRYGSLKQMDGLGPNGETIMDYSVYDAIRAGFGKVVFVIRKNFEDDFKEVFSKERYNNQIEVEYVLQELDKIPSQFKLNPERTKPWGTNHAVMMAKEVIKEPFAVINADDFYGKNAFQVLADYLKSLNGKKNDYCMVGYYLGNTLSEMGSVSRGVCSTDSEKNLTGVVERTHIEKIDGQVKYKDEKGEFISIDPKTLVSMNMWGFTPDYFDYSDAMFDDFLAKNMENIKSEFFIPLVVNNLINSRTVKLKVLDTDAQWFGVTYQGDRPLVVDKINKLVEKGEYPAKI